MAEQLSDEELLLLDNLIYLDAFSKKENEGETVEKVLKNIKYEKFDKAAMSSSSWMQIKNKVEKDDKLMNLKIVNAYHDDGKNSKKGVTNHNSGAAMTCFEDENGQAYAIFQGTSKNEWMDDVDGARQTDTVQQVQAKQWLDSLGYDNITVSGHSKGGNKAQYCTVLCDNIGRCVSFDGQGFSKEFIEKNSLQIDKNKGKILAYANSRDYVNILLNDISGKKIFLVNKTNVDSLEQYHCPNVLFAYDEYGNMTTGLAMSGEQEGAFKFLGEFVNCLVNNAAPSERDVVITQLGELLTKIDEGDYDEEILKRESFSSYYALYRYFAKFVYEYNLTHPELFAQYKEDIWKIIVEYGILKEDKRYYYDLILRELTDSDKSDIGILDFLMNSSKILNFSIEGIIDFFFGKATCYNRDFTQETKDILLAAVEEIEEEPFWDVTKWAIWPSFEEHFFGLKIADYTGDAKEYYRKVLDLNYGTKDEINKIFDAVYETDDSYSKKMKEHNSKIEELIKEIKQISSGIKA